MVTDFRLLLTARIAIQNPEIVVEVGQIGLILGDSRVFLNQLRVDLLSLQKRFYRILFDPNLAG